MDLSTLKTIDSFLVFNFLAKDQQNAKEIIEAGEGCVVPGILAADFSNIEDGFGSTIDKETGRTLSEEVAKIVCLVRG